MILPLIIENLIGACLELNDSSPFEQIDDTPSVKYAHYNHSPFGYGGDSHSFLQRQINPNLVVISAQSVRLPQTDKPIPQCPCPKILGKGPQCYRVKSRGQRDASLCSAETLRDLLNLFFTDLKKPTKLLSGVMMNIASATCLGNIVLTRS